MALTKTQVDEIIANQKHAKDQFLSAWKDGVSLHPELFNITTSSGDIDTANDKWQLCPASEDQWKNIICKLSRGERTFLASMVSFYNSSRGQDLRLGGVGPSLPIDT